MSNELTILRFRDELETDVPAISPGQLFTITESLTDVLAKAAQTLSFTEVRTELHFVTAPRRGSLEIVLQQTVEVASLHGDKLGTEIRDALTDAAAIGSFLWVVLFGGRGVVDLVRAGEAVPQQETSEYLDQLRERTAAHLAKSREVKQAAQRLLDAAVVKTARRVEVEVLDEPAVLLFTSEDRRQTSLLARGRRSGPNNVAAQGVKQVSYQGGPIIAGRLAQKDVRVFLGLAITTPGLGGHRVVIVWGSQAEIPPVGTFVDVKGDAVAGEDLKRLEIRESIPFDFEDAEGVYFVKAASTWS